MRRKLAISGTFAEHKAPHFGESGRADVLGKAQVKELKRRMVAGNR